MRSRYRYLRVLHTRVVLEYLPTSVLDFLFPAHQRTLLLQSDACWLTMSSLSTTEAFSLSALSLACMGMVANTFQGDGEPVIASLAFSGIAFASSYTMIRWLGPVFMNAGLKGRDMSKSKKPEMYNFNICSCRLSR